MTAAINTYKSTTISNRDASPSVPTPGFISKGNILSAVAQLKIAAAATDSAGSNYLMVSVPSNARIQSVLLSNASSGSAGAVNCGVFYNTEGQGGTAATAVGTNGAAFFATAASLVTAGIHTNITFQTDPTGASGYGLKQADQPLWQALGLTSDPSAYFDIWLVSSTAMVSAAQVALLVSYAV